MGSHLHTCLPRQSKGLRMDRFQGSGFRLIGVWGFRVSMLDPASGPARVSLEPSGIHRAHIVVEVLQALRT